MFAGKRIKYSGYSRWISSRSREIKQGTELCHFHDLYFGFHIKNALGVYLMVTEKDSNGLII